jgi:hypothetical protein
VFGSQGSERRIVNPIVTDVVNGSDSRDGVGTA